MIKIIKEGIKPKNYKKIYKLTCNICSCEFEFEESDCFNVRREKCIDGEHRGEVDCPCCRERLFVDFKKAEHREEEVENDTKIINIDDCYQWSKSSLKCPNCGSYNTLRNDTIVLTSLPPQYNFKCKDCGHRWTGSEKPVNFDRSSTDVCEYCNKKDNIGNDVCYSCPHYPFKIT